MSDVNNGRWQRGAAAILEPGEQVRAAATGLKGGALWTILLWPFGVLEGPLGIVSDLVFSGVFASMKLGRVYLVTDRNIYLCRLSSWQVHKTEEAVVEHIDEVLEKRPLHDATVKFRRGRLWLDDANPVYVGALPFGRRWARELVAAADGSPAAAAPT